MTFLILLFFGIIATCMTSDHDHHHGSHDHHSGHSQTSGQESERGDHLRALPMSKIICKAKKIPGAVNPFAVGGEGDACPMACVNIMNTKIGQNSQLKTFTKMLAEPVICDGHFNSQMFPKYCLIMNQTSDCIGKCSESQLKTFTGKAVSSTKFMCVDSKFLQYVPCIQNVTTIQEKICHAANKCGAKKSALQTVMTNHEQSVGNMENVLKSTCEYLTCYNDCDRPKVTQDCGMNAAKVLDEMYRKNINSIIELFQKMELQIAMPTACNSILAA